MQVHQIMTGNVTVCLAGTNLAAASELLWKSDIGVLPVTDAGGKVVGIITDRDIAIALGTRNLLGSEVLVDDVMTREVSTCGPFDELPGIMKLMGDAHIRRLPVVKEGKLCGIVSLNDIALHAGTGKQGVSCTDVLATLITVCAPSLTRAVTQGSWFVAQV
jgi:CBS domain-containing protein